MATSGTVDQTTVDVASLLDLAFRRAGKIPSTVSGELLRDARKSLFLLLTHLANRGISLWCLKKTLLQCDPLTSLYALASGTVDVTNALWRRLDDMATLGTFSAPDAQGVQLTTPKAIDNVSGAFSTAGLASLVVEYSTDGVTWLQVAAIAPATVGVPGSTFSLDLDNTFNVQWWRVRDITGTLIPIDNLLFRTVAQELSMSKLNRDDYQNLPDKAATGQNPLQYWFDKQVNPQIWVWPAAQNPGGQIVVWCHQQIQDVGALTNELAVPSRWYEAILFTLAARVAILIPPSELVQGRLEYLDGQATAHTTMAENAESDGAPWRMAPRIGGYTK